MMTATIALLLATCSHGQDTNAPYNLSASQIMTKMLGHYSVAKTVVGTVKMTQTANGVSVHTSTDLQFDRPSLLYIRQVRDGSLPHQWVVTSDGKEWSYDRPDNQLQNFGHDRYVEYVTQHGYTMTLSDFLSAASHSLGDVNPLLIAAISSKDWLKRLTGQWATLKFNGKVDVEGQSAFQIVGQYRENPAAPVSGRFEAYVTESGDFVKYVLYQRLQFPKISRDPVEVTTSWESDLKVGATTNPNLYRVITSQ